MERNMRKLILISLFIFSFPISGKVRVISKTDNSIKLLYKFEKIKFVKEGGYDYIKIENTKQFFYPGKPIIPVRIAKILIPEDKEVEKINVNNNYIKIDGSYNLNIAQIPQRIGTNRNFKRLEFSGIFPESNYSFKGIHRFKGYKILIFQK